MEHAEQAPPGILVRGGVANEISAVVRRSWGGRKVGWLNPVPRVRIATKLVAVRPFEATETVHGDLRELGGRPNLVGVAADEEDGTVGALERYLGLFEPLWIGLQDLEGVGDRRQRFAAEGPCWFGTRRRWEHESASDVAHDGREIWVVRPQGQGQLATTRGADYSEPVATHRGLVL
jgi:hypothetical protein